MLAMSAHESSYNLRLWGGELASNDFERSVSIFTSERESEKA